ncbi:MAG: NAD(P)/FAD-dependent oxidoreductase [Acidobacteriota bacterium]|nr:NAD(P)/FAD-dependent oxidoreductase [Acidobacteriota bacterium]
MDQTSSRQGNILYDWPGEGCESSLKFLDSAQLGPQPYDAVIVGAGVVGCALAYRLSRFQLRVLLVDKNFDVGEGSSKGNSAIIHTGFDATPGSLESELVTQASRQWPTLAEKLKIPYDPCGAVLLAIDDEQEAQLPKIHKKALANGVDDVRLLTPPELREIEPNAPPDVRGGIAVPRESIVDPFTASIAFAEVALANGVDLLLGASIVAVENPDAAVKTLMTSSGKRVTTRILVNAAGLGSRALADAYAGQPFDINPRRGQFLIFDKFSRPLVRGILLPVPTPQTKGVLVIPSIFGNLIAGPTAEDLPLGSPDATCTTKDGLEAVFDGAARLFPRLKGQMVIGAYAGARCNCSQGSYLIRYNDHHPGILSVIGIRSTGLTSSPALADYLIRGLVDNCELKLQEKPEAMDCRPEHRWPGWWRKPFENEDMLRRRPDYGRFTCTCENVSCGEVIDALESPLKPRTLDAVKRRTRALMGRCQGFGCLVALAEVISSRCGIPLESVTKNGPGSELLNS